jgi:hypothetical protein
MEMAIFFAREAGMDWIIHLDTDELLHPAGAAEYSLRRLLQDVAADVDMVVFPNYESAIEHDDIKDPFSEVSEELFFFSCLLMHNCKDVTCLKCQSVFQFAAAKRDE